jgi:hypothetical protein
VPLGDLATKDHCEFVGLADSSVGIQQALAELIESGATGKDQVVTVLDLREEQPVLNPGLSAFGFGEEGCQLCQPSLTATNPVLSR